MKDDDLMLYRGFALKQTDVDERTNEQTFVNVESHP